MAKVMANSESTSESDPHGQHQVVSTALKRGRSSLHLDKVQCDGNLEQPDAATAEEPEDDPEFIRAYVKARAGRCGRCLIGKGGNLLFSDQHVDISVRWVFPITYCIAFIIIVADWH